MKRAGSGGERSPQLMVQGYNAVRLPSVQLTQIMQPQAMQTDQVNILNLPLPELSIEDGEFESLSLAAHSLHIVRCCTSRRHRKDCCGDLYNGEKIRILDKPTASP